MTLSLLLRLLPGIALLALTAAFLRANDKAADWKRQAEHCAEARKADRTAYETAQKQAAESNKAYVAKKEAEYAKNNSEALDALNARLERLRRELRDHPAAGGSAGGAGSPQADGPESPAGAPRVCVAPEVVLRGAENEERHDQLITLIEKQLSE